MNQHGIRLRKTYGNRARSICQYDRLFISLLPVTSVETFGETRISLIIAVPVCI